MNNNTLTPEEKSVWCGYHVPGLPMVNKPKINVVYLRKNTPEHELMKCRICVQLMGKDSNFITEAADNLKLGGRFVVRDIVCLTDGTIIEVEVKNDYLRFLKDLQRDRIIVVKLFPDGWKWLKIRNIGGKPEFVEMRALI